MWLEYLSLLWACQGFSGGAAVGGSRVFGDEHSSLLLPGFPEGGLQSDDVTRWQYVTPGNKSPLLQYDQGRSDPAISEGYKDRVKVNPSNEPPLMRRLEVGNSSDQVKKKNESRNRSAELTLDDDTETNKVNRLIHVVRRVDSAIAVLGFQAKNRESLMWRYLNFKTESAIVSYSAGKILFSSYYKYRAEFHPLTGSLILKHLQVEDSGIYEVILNPIESNKLIKGDEIAYLQLDVQEQLLAPMIVQDPAYVVDRVELNCFVNNGKASGILWQKDNKPILKSSYYRLAFDNTTLFIKDMKVSDCGLYTCTVKNGVSTSSNSHFLTVNGILFIHEYALVGSVIALVSTVTSFAATTFIILALDKNQVEKYWRQVTAVVMIFHVLSFICQLVAFVIIQIHEGFPIGYRIGLGIGCLHGLAVLVYVVTLFLQRPAEQSLSFLSTNSGPAASVYGEQANYDLSLDDSTSGGVTCSVT
ncbi:uncharacterized protein [Heptranchias perlo]|uniref:uncharacterized protein isoform X1 n=1 Tax=Heptranchias perlo TaxID=212740 RepID=UPI003559C88E